MTVYDRLREWQAIPNAYEDWREYRKGLTDRILSCKDFAGGSALILGAGACNDLDLRRLSEAFETITLLDRETAPMKEGVLRQLGAASEKIEMVAADLLGITDEDYRTFCELLQSQVNLYGKQTDLDMLAQEACGYIDEIYEKTENALQNKAFSFTIGRSWDMVIIAGVHSQLNNMFAWIFDAYSQALGKRANVVNQSVANESTKRIRLLHAAVLGWAKKDVFLALEECRVGIPGGVQGAYQGIQDLFERSKRGEIRLIEKEELGWPFDSRQGIIYQMRIFNIKI